MENNWHIKTSVAILGELQSGEGGLSKAEAERRLGQYGPNKLPEAKADGLAAIFLRQFKSPLIYVLLASAAMIFAIGDIADSLIILSVLVFNAVVGAIQVGRAQYRLLALKKFVETAATVVRDGQELIIPDVEVAFGDIVVLREGEKVPADARMIFANNLKIDEAALTGESEPVQKITEALISPSLPVAEMKNMVFKGTNVVGGYGKAAVVATGTTTIIGKISQEVAAIDTEIPLRANIRALSRLIVAVVAGIAAVVFSLGLAYGKTILEMFSTAVSLSVSIIPEGLPIVMTLVLATGVHRMTKRNALIKKLQAVEALGQARVLAVDKTGTITKNEMVIQKAYVDGRFFEIGGMGYEPKGDISWDGKVIDPLNHPELLFAGKIAAFSANAGIAFREDAQIWRAIGDPTEAALLVFAEKIGFRKDDLERESPKVAEIPFDYRTKYYANLHKVDHSNLLTVSGAPEAVLKLTKKIRRDGKEIPFSKNDRDDLESVFLKMSGEGLRVITLAVNRNVHGALQAEEIRDLTFVGFFGMKDALRPEAREAVRAVEAAGIRVVMITGDHKATAEAIAGEAGIYRAGSPIISGEDMDALSDEELAGVIGKVSVFARVTPEHKLRIIRAYKKTGEIVAMTGDGVNDAPSLVAADLGVAMGKIGTEVAKEAADIVLLDDNFGSIVAAVEEGRNIYKTIKKVILYLFSTSLGEIFTIVGALLLGYPLPILPAQIIWLNFVTDGFLDVALAMEPREDGLLRGNFEHPKKYLVDSLMAKRMVLMAIPMVLGTLWLFQKYFATDIVRAWTMALTALAVFQWFNAWNSRSEGRSIFGMNPLANKFLMAATAIVFLLHLLALYNPIMQKILHTAPLSLREWGTIVAVATSIIAVEEIRKLFYRRRFARVGEAPSAK